MLLICVWNALDSIPEYNLIPFPSTGAISACSGAMAHSMRRDFFNVTET
jgi:hypothetical protein